MGQTGEKRDGDTGPPLEDERADHRTRFKPGNKAASRTARNAAAARQKVPPMLRDMRWAWEHQGQEGKTAGQKTAALQLKEDRRAFMQLLGTLEGRFGKPARQVEETTTGDMANRLDPGAEKCTSALEAFLDRWRASLAA